MEGCKREKRQVKNGFYYYPIGSDLSRGYGITYNLQTRRIIRSKCLGASGKQMSKSEWQEYIEANINETVVEVNEQFYIVPEGITV